MPVPAATGSLGLSLQWTPLAVVSNIWHVLDVPANSPAEAAGLLPYSDYILGTPEGALHGESGLGELVEDHIGRPLRLSSGGRRMLRRRLGWGRRRRGRSSSRRRGWSRGA